MKEYLEAKEILYRDSELQPEFARVEVTAKTPDEKEAILKALIDVLADVDCIYTIHYCGHPNEKCISEVL